MAASASIVTVGNFDGVHLGHRALVEAARSVLYAGRAARVVAMVFDPHPAEALRPGAQPPRLSTFAQRERWLKDAGVSDVVRLNPLRPSPDGRGVLSLSAEEFVAWAVREHGAMGFVEGADFRFGRGREGTVADLQRLAGFAEVVPTVEVTLPGGERVAARSGVVRGLVDRGRVSDAAVVLGRPYELEGEVVRGERVGRTLGFPTVNVRTEQMLPTDGVYAATAELPEGPRVPAAVSLGVKPTFAEGGSARTLEAHLIGIGGAGRLIAESEYGWTVRLRLLERLRPQVKFGGLEELKSAIADDCERVEAIVNAGARRA